MATVSLQTPVAYANRCLSFVKSSDGSLQTPVYKSINSSRQHGQHRSVIPMAVKSMKISEQRLEPVRFPNFSIFQQTCNMPTSNFKDKNVEASQIENGDMSPEREAGVSVFILKDNKILFGRRRSVSVATNVYLLPGGHLESGESYEECAAREVKEETGLDITNIELLTSVNRHYYDATHLEVTYARAQLSDPNQTPQNIEPDKCEGWEWYDWNNLPEPMFGPLREMLQDGFNPFSIGS
ncbi:hypothetical protein R6Q59_002660 [Mikania micrantha]|uniref:Nudix hydrolase domain-containing protein n=1 Tax=Mikania micrantha TaxID=192012 RepID=A0A5N6NNW8_9ASTR|nr:hypothetical protein E3N88_19678 [Mikania micrantha]